MAEPILSNPLIWKKCYKCSEVKPVADFNRDRQAACGLKSDCRECSNARARRHYRANSAKHNARRVQHMRDDPAARSKVRQATYHRKRLDYIRKCDDLPMTGWVYLLRGRALTLPGTPTIYKIGYTAKENCQKRCREVISRESGLIDDIELICFYRANLETEELIHKLNAQHRADMGSRHEWYCFKEDQRAINAFLNKSQY